MLDKKKSKVAGFNPFSHLEGSSTAVPHGFLQMVYIDVSRFDREHYQFTYVGREFLGEVRCAIFEVVPLPKAGKNSFYGRIWAEDQGFAIVRFNGMFTSSGSEGTGNNLHFDSWRMNLQPNLWLPAFVYSQESELKSSSASSIRFKAQTRLWGYNLGAYAALREAETDKRVQALVLDSVYDSPQQMVKVGVERQGLGGFPLMTKSAEFSFQWLNHQYRGELPLSNTARMASLTGVQKLFINAADEPELGDVTRQMYLKAPEPKDQASIGHGNFADMGDDDKRAYENRVVSFFLLRLPPTGPAAH